MPGDDALYPEDGEKLTQEQHEKLVSWATSAFTAADAAREPYAERWKRYYKKYRSYVKRRPQDWRSRVFMPVTFYVIETITPKIVAQIPDFVVRPIGEEDVEGAETMEEMLNWSADKCYLFTELVAGFKDSFMYGTGILKVFHKEEVKRIRQTKVEQRQAVAKIDVPMLDEQGHPIFDLDGAMQTEVREVPTGETTPHYSQVVEPVTTYDGPAAECVDPFNFWVAPEATSIEDARYVIQRTFREMSYIANLVRQGIYTFPEGEELEEWAGFNDEPAAARLREIGIDVSPDPTLRAVEVLEFWTDTRVITLLNRRTIVRAQTNPFDHGMKPYIKIVDHAVPHEFYGIGEVEPIEGLQDLMNSLTNARIDNVKLVLNAMFVVNADHIQDLRDLVMRPGGTIRVREPGVPINQVVQRIDLGDVTASSFEEVQLTQDTIERTTSVSSYQQGVDSPSQNDTATGVNIITEQGNSRFALKMKLNENGGLKRLANMFGSIIQQFMPESLVLRVFGEKGVYDFKQVTQESILGNFDYDIEPQSTSVTESLRKEQAMSLLQVGAQTINPATGLPVADVEELYQDVLRAFGIKDRTRLTAKQPELPPAPEGGDQTGLGMDAESAPQQPPVQAVA